MNEKTKLKTSVDEADLVLYSYHNKKRDSEDLDEWGVRIYLRESIRNSLFRKVNSKEATYCLLCGYDIEDSYVHSECITERVTFRKDVNEIHERYLYGLYKFQQLVYIGIAVDPRARFKQHLLTKDVTEMQVVSGGPSIRIEEKEKRMIHKHYPALNSRLHDKDGRQFSDRDLLERKVNFLDAYQQGVNYIDTIIKVSDAITELHEQRKRK